MKALAVGGHEADDISKLVSKILKGIGNPEPPLRLELIRELLRLDRHYYSATDTWAIQEYVSRVWVAGQQILLRKTLLWDAIRKAKLSALYLPDTKRILIDSSIPAIKHRWSEAHEVGHSLIPWHKEMNLGDTDFTLRPACHAIVEAEANYAAGQMLFLQGRFVSEAQSGPRSIDYVKSLATRYGNTVTSTLWRFVEEGSSNLPVVGLVSQHPRYPDANFDPNQPCRYCVQSPVFRTQFQSVSELELFELMKGYISFRKRGPLGEAEVVLVDDNGQDHVFRFESFCNGYDVLTIGVHQKKRAIRVAM